jgi:hypothetical protein
MFAPMVAGWAVFAGNTLRESKAKPIKIDSGDSSTDTEITIPLSALHTIHGHVLLKSNGEPPPLAKIQLLYADTKELARTAIAQDGEFEIRYVPEDHYTLRAVASPDSDDHSGVGVVEGFLWQPELAWSTKEIPKGMAEISLEVTADLDNVSIVVPDPPMNRRAVRDETKGGN